MKTFRISVKKSGKTVNDKCVLTKDNGALLLWGTSAMKVESDKMEVMMAKLCHFS